MMRTLATVRLSHEALLLAYDPSGLVRRIVLDLHLSLLAGKTVVDHVLHVRAEDDCTCFQLVAAVKEETAP